MAIPKINNPNCVSDTGNTGVVSCPKDLTHIKGLILVPKSTVFTEAQVADFETTLKALFIATNPAARAYPIIGFEDFTDSSTEQKEETLGFGTIVPLEGTEKYIFELRHIFGVDLHNKLRKFNTNKSFGVIFCLSDGTYLATKRTDTNGNVGYTPIPYDNWNAKPLKLADGKGATTMYNVKIILSDSKDINDNYGFIESTYAKMLELKGLIDFTHVATGGVLKISLDVFTTDDKVNMLDVYSSELADFATIVVKKGGVVKTVGTTADDLVSIAYNATTNKLDIIFYAGSAGVFTVEYKDPATLATNGVGGAPGNYYENLTIASATVTAT